jgi:hypothetical protein
MIVLNFTHPLTEGQQAQIEALSGQAITQMVACPTHLDHAAPFVEQVAALVAGLDLPSETWQGAPIVVNPPALASAAAVVLAELHGRMGYFPPVVRMRPVPEALPPQYEVAEIINLQALRDAARARR